MSEKLARPAATYLVDVRLKAEFPDGDGQAAQARLHSLGVYAKDVRTSKLYCLRGPLNAGQVQQAARDLLCDPVTEEYRMASPSAAPVLNGMNYWRVEVWLKDTVTDPVGESVLEAVAELGLPAPELVRVGTAYHIAGKCGRNQLEKAVARTFANPLIHRVSVSEAHP